MDSVGSVWNTKTFTLAGPRSVFQCQMPQIEAINKLIAADKYLSINAGARAATLFSASFS